MSYSYRAYFNRRWTTFQARNIREAARLAVYAFLAADGQPVAVGREQSSKPRDFARWAGRVWPYTVLDTVKRMAQNTRQWQRDHAAPPNTRARTLFR
jgi:hypothetical protein